MASTPPAVSRDFAEAFLRVRFPNTHGGLTPAALVSVSHGRRTVRDFRGTALGSPNHGGLTPAALVNLRSCIEKIVFCRQTFALQQERGASAPRGMFSVCELETWKPSALPLQTWFPTSGRLASVAGRKRPQLQLRYQTHGGMTPAAPGCRLGRLRTMLLRLAHRSYHTTRRLNLGRSRLLRSVPPMRGAWLSLVG